MILFFGWMLQKVSVIHQKIMGKFCLWSLPSISHKHTIMVLLYGAMVHGLIVMLCLQLIKIRRLLYNYSHAVSQIIISKEYCTNIQVIYLMLPYTI